MSYFII